MLLTFVAFIIVLGIVVFVHELGHFLAARLVGARVEVFSLGMPPKVAAIKKGDTEYRIGAIPLGGYVKISGMIDESLDTESTLTGADYEFMSKNTWQKTFIITAGVIMNFIVGITVYSIISLAEGEAKLEETPVIGTVVRENPADLAGMLEGDLIISIDDVNINSWEELANYVHAHPADTLSVNWMRDGQNFNEDIVTLSREVFINGEKQTIGLLGISQKYFYEPVGPIRAVQIGFGTTYRIIAISLESLGRLVSGNASMKEFTGPVGIIQLSGETARAGWTTYLGFIGLISVSIGLLNIMPIPALDGGHLVIILIEGIIRRPIPTKVKIVVQQIGLAVLFILIIFVTYNDIFKIFKG